MNPWWLRPPAEEKTPAGEKSEKPARSQPASQPSKSTGKPVEPERETALPRSSKKQESRPSRKRSAGRRRQNVKGRKERLTVLCDAGRLALSMRSADVESLDLRRVMSDLAARGQLDRSVAYGDWQRLGEIGEALQQAGFERVGSRTEDVGSGSRPAIQLIVDAMELCYTPEAPDTVVLVSGDPDLLPLVEKLRGAGKKVIGVGFRQLLTRGQTERYQEFIGLEEPVAETDVSEAVPAEVDESKAVLFSLLGEIIEALGRERGPVIWGSELKREMRRRRPELIAGGLGYATFSEFLEDADRHGVILLERDDRTGSYYVSGGADE